MSGLENYKGISYQTKCTVYTFLSLWAENSQFILEGEPHPSIEDGDIGMGVKSFILIFSIYETKNELSGVASLSVTNVEN